MSAIEEFIRLNNQDPTPFVWGQRNGLRVLALGVVQLREAVQARGQATGMIRAETAGG